MKIQILFDRVEHTFRRKQITSVEYLNQLVIYIHNNPVHHHFCDHPIEYHWSSYENCLPAKNTGLMHNVVMDWFDHDNGFKLAHHKPFYWKSLSFDNCFCFVVIIILLMVF